MSANRAVDLAARFTRDSAFYTVVTLIVFPIALAQTLIITHYLNAAQFGRIAVLFTASGLMTVILNMFFLRGIERTTWGSTDDLGELDLDDLVASNLRTVTLGTGVVITILLAVLTIAAGVVFARPVSQWLLHSPRYHSAVVWMVVSAALGSVWRLISNIARWERRLSGYAAIWIIRPVLAVVLVWALVIAGDGVTGVVAGTAIATLVAAVYGLLISRHSFVIAIDWSAVAKVTKVSMQFSAAILGLYVLHVGDVILLSRFIGSAQVGAYNLAQNITSVVSYAVSAFLMAWAPLEWSTVFQAAYKDYGIEHVRSQVLTYYLVLGFFLVLALQALATPIVGVFAPSYRKAAGFVAITGAGYLAYGLVLNFARTTQFSRRYLFYGLSAVSGAGALVITSILLAPSIGGFGVALGDIVGGLVASALILTAGKLTGKVPQANVRKLVILAVIAGGCWALGSPLANLAHGWSAVLKVASVALFPILLVAIRVIPARDLGLIWAALRQAVRPRSNPEVLIERIGGLPSTERRILLAIARDREPNSRVTALIGLPQATVRVRLVWGLRKLCGAGPPGEHDPVIADYLLSGASVTERDGVARELTSRGVEWDELHDIETTFTTLRRAPARAWSAASVGRPPDLPPGPWSLNQSALELLDEVVRKERPRRQVAAGLGLRERERDRRLIGALRSLTNGGGSSPADMLIAAFLFDRETGPPAQQLWAAGVDPTELHRLELTVQAIRATPPDKWREAVSFEDAELAATGALLEPATP